MSDERGVELWTRVLDAYDDSLDRSVAALAGTIGGGVDQPVAFTPPAALPPMPESLRPRAAALAARTDELIARVATAASEIQPTKVVKRHRPPRSHAPTVTFDRRG